MTALDSLLTIVKKVDREATYLLGAQHMAILFKALQQRVDMTKNSGGHEGWVRYVFPNRQQAVEAVRPAPYLCASTQPVDLVLGLLESRG